ncbi:MAG: hypothetical protein ABI895_08055 [Deltaproteobacteria bacterium]
MSSTFWSFCIAMVLAVTAGLALHPAAARWSRRVRTSERGKGVVVLRLCLVSLALLAALAELSVATSSIARPLHWGLWSIALLSALAWLLNTLAGLWLLSPFVSASPGDGVVACGQRGRIMDCGLLCLELETEPGWRAALPYIAVACRPLLVNKESQARGAEFVFERPDWTEDEIRFLRQVAVLAPYRDITTPVTCSRCADRVSLRLSLSHPAAEEQMRGLLTATLERYLGRPNPHEPTGCVALEAPSD